MMLFTPSHSHSKTCNCRDARIRIEAAQSSSETKHEGMSIREAFKQTQACLIENDCGLARARLRECNTSEYPSPLFLSGMYDGKNITECFEKAQTHDDPTVKAAAFQRLCALDRALERHKEQFNDEEHSRLCHIEIKRKIGICYLFGYGTRADIHLAAEQFANVESLLGTKEENPLTFLEQGVRCFNEIKSTMDSSAINKAAYCFLQAAKEGSTAVQPNGFTLLEQLSKGKVFDCRDARRHGDPESLEGPVLGITFNNLAKCLQHGYSCAKNNVAALQAFERAKSLGYPVNEFHLAQLHATLLQEETDVEKRQNYRRKLDEYCGGLLRKAETDLKARYALAQAYELGLFLPAKAETRESLQRAIDLYYSNVTGDNPLISARATLRLATMYRRGIGMEVNLNSAIKLLLREESHTFDPRTPKYSRLTKKLAGLRYERFQQLNQLYHSHQDKIEPSLRKNTETALSTYWSTLEPWLLFIEKAAKTNEVSTLLHAYQQSLNHFNQKNNIAACNTLVNKLSKVVFSTKIDSSKHYSLLQGIIASLDVFLLHSINSMPAAKVKEINKIYKLIKQLTPKGTLGCAAYDKLCGENTAISQAIYYANERELKTFNAKAAEVARTPAKKNIGDDLFTLARYFVQQLHKKENIQRGLFVVKWVIAILEHYEQRWLIPSDYLEKVKEFKALCQAAINFTCQYKHGKQELAHFYRNLAPIHFVGTPTVEQFVTHVRASANSKIMSQIEEGMRQGLGITPTEASEYKKTATVAIAKSSSSSSSYTGVETKALLETKGEAGPATYPTFFEPPESTAPAALAEIKESKLEAAAPAKHSASGTASAPPFSLLHEYVTPAGSTAPQVAVPPAAAAISATITPITARPLPAPTGGAAFSGAGATSSSAAAVASSSASSRLISPPGGASLSGVASAISTPTSSVTTTAAVGVASTSPPPPAGATTCATSALEEDEFEPGMPQSTPATASLPSGVSSAAAMFGTLPVAAASSQAAEQVPVEKKVVLMSM